MDAIEIRPPRKEEFHEVVGVSNLAFGEEVPPEDEAAFSVGFPFDRALCAYEGGRMVAVSAVYSLELTIPGRTAVSNGGVTWIATLPTHRRRGFLRRLMTAQLADMRGRGEAVSTLLAAEGTIYGRFGYGPATSVASFRVRRPYAVFTDPLEDPDRMILLNAEEAAAQLPPLYEAVRLSQPGAVSRSAGWWTQYLYDPVTERGGATKMIHAKHQTKAGGDDGYVSYRVKEEWDGYTSHNEVQVVEVMATSPTAYKALWNYVLNTDLSHTISCVKGRVDEPLRWLLVDPRRFEVTALADDLYLRLLDVPRALAARAYRATGELVLEVTDCFPVPGANRYALRVAPASDPPSVSSVECEPTKRKPHLAIGIADLGAAYLGGVSFTALATAGRVQELSAGAVERADTLFSTSLAPHNSTEF
jgi:predicted acetyltransferase